MRNFFIFASLPMLAAAPVSVKITRATVTWGAGVEPKGNVPPGHFDAQVRVAGGRQNLRPEFRVWRVKMGDFPGLEGSKARFPSMGKSMRLDATVTKGEAGHWMLQGTWHGAPRQEDRLVVEVRSGSRRLGWTFSQLEEHLIPTIEKRPGVSRENEN